ncbi:colicin E3/pyocin S6 family cytotoxin [Listeria cornellensis]|nr:colicin E3/pyocin S6 family cytotoxin [Listeria cornellensis]
MAAKVAKKNGWKEVDKDIKSKNVGRKIYTDGKNYYSLDTQHGRFEMQNKRGKHQGEIDMDLNKITNKPADKSGRHDINVK